MRILWTAGAQKIAINEAMELKQMGHDVEIIFLKGKKSPEYDELLKNVNYRIISDTGKSFLSPLYSYITRIFAPDRGVESRIDYNLLKRFPKYILDKNVDYIICHDQFSGIAGYESLKKRGIKYSVFIHERLYTKKIFMLSAIWHRYEHKILKNAVKVFSITEKVAKSVEEIHNIKPITNYPGMNIKTVTEFEKKENAIMAVSMWDYGRKPELYLDIIERIPDFILYFVGNFRIKKLESEIKRKIREKKLEQRVIMKQGVKESELIELYQKCKFVIRFGFGEYGIGTATMEAIQNCDPLIINSDLGASELVRKYSCGIVINNINTDEIKKFIDKNNNTSLYKALQENIIKLPNDYSWKKHAEPLINFDS